MKNQINLKNQILHKKFLDDSHIKLNFIIPIEIIYTIKDRMNKFKRIH
jgi:hypothetical protein